MRGSFAVPLLLLVLALTADAQTTPSTGAPSTAISRTGTLNGAPYRIEVPANWRGGLVMYAHGIQRGPGPGAVTTPPLATHLRSEGHAYAASGYRAREYRPDLFIEDVAALRDLFVGIHWATAWYLVGYKGFSAREDWLLNIAGISSVLLSITPCHCWTPLHGSNRIHDFFAIAFFVAAATACLLCARETIGLLPEARQRVLFARAYRVIGVLLALSPAAGMLLSIAGMLVGLVRIASEKVLTVRIPRSRYASSRARGGTRSRRRPRAPASPDRPAPPPRPP